MKYSTLLLHRKLTKIAEQERKLRELLKSFKKRERRLQEEIKRRASAKKAQRAYETGGVGGLFNHVYGEPVRQLSLGSSGLLDKVRR